MNPNDKKPLGIPSSPPPDQLPRPRMQRMSDVRPLARPPVSSRPPAAKSLDSVSVGPSLPRPSLGVTKSADTSSGAVEQALPPLDTPPSLEGRTKKRRSRLKIVLLCALGLIILAGTVVVAGFMWYQQQLTAVSPESSTRVRVVVQPGSTPSTIAAELKQKSLIRDETAFLIYTYLAKVRDGLKAGTYNLKPSESTPELVNHLVSGKQDEFSLTFLPGDTLANHRKRIINAGYSAEEVDAAFKKTYSRPLFAGKPATADLEGYIYGETYSFLSSANVEDILNRTFDEFEKKIKENNMLAKFQAQDLTLFEGITLASIVQKEVPTPQDQKQVAQVFYNRIAQGMTLGSDVTYQYIADKTGVARDPTLNSPYNTRRFKGLTPGPIASPGLSALQAVAEPASHDYLFFLSGDDNKTYFGRTDAEHQQNITRYCQKKCQIL